MKSHPSLTIVYATVFIDLLGFGIILPLLPFYAQAFGATGLWVGALFTAYSAAQFVGAPLLGRLSDRVGRRPVLLAALAGSAISLAFTGWAFTLPLLLVGRLIAGLFGGSIATAQAYIADVTTREERTRYMGLLGASIGLGFVFGPALGGALAGFGFGTAAFVAAGLAALNFLVALFLLPESRPAGRSVAPHARLTVANLLDALGHPAIGRILGATFLATFAFVGMEATFALLGEQNFNLDAAGMGLVFTFVGIVIVIVQGGLIGRLNARYGERALATAGSVIMGASLLAVPFAPGLPLAIVVLGVLAIGQALVTPTLTSLLSHASDADEQGGILGIGQSLGAAARATGPIVAGWLFDFQAALPYVVGAALMLLGAWLVSRLAQPTPSPEWRTSHVADH